MTKKLDFYAWHAFDYAADTSHLSREADYAYRRIIDEIFRTAQDTCRIKDDDEYLRAVARATEEEWRRIRRELIDGAKPLLVKKNGYLSQPRLTEEIRRANEKASQNRRNATGARAQGDRIAFAPQNKSKKKPTVSKRKSEVVNTTSLAGADEIRASLRDAGIGITKAAEKLIVRWSRDPGVVIVCKLLTDNLDKVQSADKPLSYLRWLVNNVRPADSEPAPEPFVGHECVPCTRPEHKDHKPHTELHCQGICSCPVRKTA